MWKVTENQHTPILTGLRTLTVDREWEVVVVPRIMGLCVWSWLARHPAKIEITRSSGRSSHHTKILFFLQKSWFFSIFNQFFHVLVPMSWICLRTAPRRAPRAADSSSSGITSLRSKSAVRATLTSWRSLPPEPPKHQYLLTGPIPQRSDLRHLHPLDESTRQPRGRSHRSQNGHPCTPRTCGVKVDPRVNFRSRKRSGWTHTFGPPVVYYNWWGKTYRFVPSISLREESDEGLLWNTTRHPLFF